MPVLPIPMIIALLLAGFLLHRVLTRDTQPALLILIGCCVVQSAVIALVQYYGFASLRVLQPILASMIPVIAWLAFRQAVMVTLQKSDVVPHLMGPALAVISLPIYPQVLDVLIPLLFAGYGFAIGVSVLRGEDSLPHSRLENGRMSVLVWRVLAIALVASAGTDVIIAIRLADGHTDILFWLPSFFSSITLLVLGAIGLSHAIESQAATVEEQVAYTAQDKQRDTAILAKLEVYVASQKPYLDPDLTLARLARKLGVPEKQLSSAINKNTGENVSRYINAHRIHYAAALMQGGTSVTEAMFASGFNTKSNFNREFLRVLGVNPRLWLKSVRDGA